MGLGGSTLAIAAHSLGKMNIRGLSRAPEGTIIGFSEPPPAAAPGVVNPE